MTETPTGTWTELAHRSGDGLEVTLVWRKTEGRDEVAVHVADMRDAQFFEIPAEPARALQVYHHPFAYRDVPAATTEESSLTA